MPIRIHLDRLLLARRMSLSELACQPGDILVFEDGAEADAAPDAAV